MWGKKRVFWCLVFFLVFYGLGFEVVYGDGKFIPAAAIKASPAIPSQRAILVYRDKMETLVIESALDGEGQEFGWVIPLPSKPTEFEKVSPGLIKTLSLVLQPDITDDLSQTVNRSGIFFLIVLVIIIYWRASKPWKWQVRVLVLGGLVIYCLYLLMPTMGTKLGRGISIPRADIEGVEVIAIEVAGSYELAVLEVERAEGLGEWLEGNGFAGLTDEDRGIVADYIGEGWCFVAAKLRRDGDGYSEPHPLAMTFACKRAVYPMRLTGTVGNDVYLELFVVAEKRAYSDKLVLEVTDGFGFRPDMYIDLYADEDTYMAGYAGNFFKDIHIGHPTGQKYLWDGCVVSKLTGTLTPRDMADDINVDWSEGRPFQRHYFSHKGARHIGQIVGYNAGWILLIFLSLWFKGRKVDKHEELDFWAKRIFLPALLIAALLGIVTYAGVHKVEVEKHRYFSGKLWGSIAEMYLGNYIEDIAEETEKLTDLNTEGLKAYILGHEKLKEFEEKYVGREMIEEDSPGNYEFIEDERGLVFRWYTFEGFGIERVVSQTARSSVWK